jgi:hypothetical protein
MSAVLIFAFDPVYELGGCKGVLLVDAEQAARLVAEHKAEMLEEHRHESMRYVTGSAANLEAGEALRALRAARDQVGVDRMQVKHKPGRRPRLQG